MPTIDRYFVCPYCLRDNEAVSHPDENWPGPKPGDWSLCFVCARFSVVNATASALRQLVPDEVEAIRNDSHLQRARWLVMTCKTPSEVMRRLREGEP
jgi:hypothetical protein